VPEVKILNGLTLLLLASFANKFVVPPPNKSFVTDIILKLWFASATPAEFTTSI